MIYRFARIASYVLAFGFFISCSVLQPTTTPKTSAYHLSEKQIQQQIDSLDQKIDTGNTNPDLLYQKGMLLTELAQKRENPTQRITPYSDAHRSLSQAVRLYQNSSNPTAEKVNEHLKITWSIEHNEGVKILQSDTAGTLNFSRAAAHFENATIVIPDSAISYKMKARAFYKNQQPQKAIGALEEARQNIETMPAVLLEQLAFLYLENDQPRKAVAVYEEAESFSDQNLNLIHGLSNAYIQAGEHQKAVELLQQLIKNKPENIIYGQSLATELYFIAEQHLDSLASNLREGKELDSNTFEDADSLLEQSENQFKKILDANPEDQDLKHSFANFYHNSASKYQQLLPLVDKSTKASIENKIEKYLSSSIPLLEQLTEKSPDNKEIWRNLYQAYSYLGMEEKARKAKSNF